MTVIRKAQAASLLLGDAESRRYCPAGLSSATFPEIEALIAAARVEARRVSADPSDPAQPLAAQVLANA